MPSRHLLTIVAALALTICPAAPALAAKNPATICNLVRARAFPANVDHGCHPQGKTSAVFGSGFLAPAPGTHAFKLTIARLPNPAGVLAFHKQASTLAASTKGTISAVKVGTWARAVTFAAAGGVSFVQINFTVNGYSCVEVYANPGPKDAVKIGRAVATQLA
jgi:hypothetical protein